MTFSLLTGAVWAVTAGSLVRASLSAEAPTPLRAFWPLDEGAGDVASDFSGNWNDGSLHGVAWGEGKVGSGLAFGGTGADSYVEIPDSESLQRKSGFTVQFWWKKGSNAVQIFFRKGGRSGQNNYYAYLEGDLHFSVSAADGKTYGVTAPRPADGWRHLTFTYDGDRLSIAVDGQTVASEKIGPVRLSTDESPLYLGTHSPGYKYCLAGVLDEFCIADPSFPPEALPKELEQARSARARPVQVENFPARQGGIVLAQDGNPGATIIIKKEASFLQREPARELQKYLFKITGVRLPIRDDSEAITGHLILVGESRLTAEMGLDRLEGDSFIIRATSGRLVLAGHDAVLTDRGALNVPPAECKWGTAHAVHAFLQDTCGVRWFMPGQLGEVVPKRSGLEVPAMEVREKPNRLYALGSFWDETSQNWAWRNLFGSAVFIRHLGGHLWYSLIPTERYFPDHPEWFAFRNGERSGEGNHLCTANEDLLAQALANLQALYDQGYEWVELGQTDGYQRCQCPACEALDEYRDPSGYWVPERPADRIHLFHAALAQRIREGYPGRKVLIIAYGPTGEVPHRLTAFPDNVAVEFTHDPPVLLQRWNRFHHEFTAYVYWFGLYHGLGYAPKSSPFYVASELRRMRAAGSRAFYFCGGGECWGTEAASYYVLSQLLRSPQQNEEHLLREFCQGLFGQAAAPMQAFFRAFLGAADRYHRLSAIPVQPGEPYRGEPKTPAEVYLACFDAPALAECPSLLEQAAQAEADESVQRQIQFFRDGFDYVRLTAAGFRRMKEWEERQTGDTQRALRQAVQERNAFVREMFARQAANAGDLPPVFRGSLEEVLYGPGRNCEKPFGMEDGKEKAR